MASARIQTRPEPDPGQRRNAYYCDMCRTYIVTIDRDEGVTPMLLACRVLGEPDALANTCGGTMRSMGYPPSEAWPEWIANVDPGWEWYRPDAAELASYDHGMRDHIERGGLALREIVV